MIFLATLPVRYAVGAWYNIPTTTLLTFNATYLGIHTLVFWLRQYAIPKWDFTPNQNIAIGLVSRSCFALTALSITSKLTDPMPFECATMTTLASLTTSYALSALNEWRHPKNE